MVLLPPPKQFDLPLMPGWRIGSAAIGAFDDVPDFNHAAVA